MLSAFDKKDSRGGITVSVLEAPGLNLFPFTAVLVELTMKLLVYKAIMPPSVIMVKHGRIYFSITLPVGLHSQCEG